MSQSFLSVSGISPGSGHAPQCPSHAPGQQGCHRGGVHELLHEGGCHINRLAGVSKEGCSCQGRDIQLTCGACWMPGAHAHRGHDGNALTIM
eukprot:7264599-Pyramimonas_sp.AAC.1